MKHFSTLFSTSIAIYLGKIGAIDSLHVILSCSYILLSDSIEKWISEFFTHSDAEARHTFANEIGHRLHHMNETQQQEQWNHWLKPYWQNRLDGVPKPLESDEIKRMMDWLPHLKGVFSEAVDLAIQMPQSESGGKRASEVIFELERSDLPEMHPEATAKLVLYMRPSLPPTDLAYRREKQIQRELIGRLLQSPLPLELKTKLQELDAKLLNASFVPNLTHLSNNPLHSSTSYPRLPSEPPPSDFSIAVATDTPIRMAGYIPPYRTTACRVCSRPHLRSMQATRSGLLPSRHTLR